MLISFEVKLSRSMAVTILSITTNKRTSLGGSGSRSIAGIH